MQNIGFLYSLMPGAQKIQKDTNSAQEIMERHRNFFNTQPYMAPTLMGVILNLEEHDQQNVIERIKSTLSGSLAAIGDTFFWATLKPIIALLCLFGALFQNLWCILIAVVLFNIAHFWIMTWGFSKGYGHGLEGALQVGKTISVDRTRIISYVIPLLCGVIIAIVPAQMDPKGFILSFAVFACCLLAQKIKMNVIWIFYGFFIIILVWTMMR